MKKNNENNNTEKNIIEGKTILLVNTGNTKKRFILQKIKKLGVKIIALNKEKNWAQAYVDEWIYANTNIHSDAIKSVEKFLKKNPKIKIDGVITFWEDDVLLTSKLAEKFNFIGIPYESANIARNKFLFRKFCKENKLPYIKHLILSSDKDIDNVMETFSFPLVIKPVYGSSSAYVMKIENEEELRQSFKYIKNSISQSVESSLSDGLDIMVEEYIDGDEVDVDILIQNGRLKFYSVSDNDKTNEPFFIETGRSTPSNLPLSSQNDLINIAYECLEKIGIQNGCIHFEAKETKNGPIPIEINLRMGGDEMYSSVKVAWHVDLIENALKIAMGIYVPETKKMINPYKYIVSKDFISNESGILSRLDINEKLKENKHVHEIQFFKDIGDSIFMPPEGYDYLGWITVVGDNYLDAQDNLEEAVKLVNFEVARFHPMSSIGKTSRKNSFSFSALNHSSIIIDRTKIEKIRKMSIANQKNLHIGIACNIYDKKNSLVENELSSVGNNIEKALKEKGYKVTFFDFNNITKAFNDLKTSDVDMVFNVCERINDSSLLEPHATSILDVLQIPYTGSNPFTLGLCIDKIRVKKLLTYHKIPTPKWDYLYSLDDDIRDDLKYPLIVKPANTDNSIGITNDSVVTNKEQLKKQLHKVMVEIGRPALIEEYIEGDEYDVSIIGSNEDDLRVLPLSRSIFDNMPEGYWHIYPFEAKYTNDANYKKIIVQRPPKNLNKKLEALISEIALDTYNILDCHDYGRVEIRVDKNHNPYVLELNPNPSINITDCVPSVAKLIGLNYGDFIEEIIRLSIKRYKDNPPYFHLQPNIM